MPPARRCASPRSRWRPAGGGSSPAELTIDRPRLWDLGKGNLYDLTVSAGAAGGARASYRTRFGVRDVRKDSQGRVFLNGRRLVARGISLHEDDARVGSAWRRRELDGMLRRVRDLNATVVRAHYPLHPYVMEQLDRRGVMVWDTAPVNIVQNRRWAKASVRRAAVRVSEEIVLRDRGHPSVLAFVVADELPIPVRSGQVAFMRAAARRVRQLDPTHMVALDRVARYGAPDDADPAFRVFDALGINEYFGWYRGALPPRPPAGAAKLRSYYDRLHRLQPGAALFVTEFGAEANRRGPVREKGTYAHQARFLRRAPGRGRLAAVPERRVRVGAARLPRALRLGRRQSAPAAAVEPEGPAGPPRPAQARLLCGARRLRPPGQEVALGLHTIFTSAFVVKIS